VSAADQALSDLTEISSQVEAAALFDAKGRVSASTLPDAETFVRAAQDLLAAANEVSGRAVAQLEAAMPAGSVFVVREGDEYIAATTHPEPTVALVFYDLKTALRASTAAKKSTRARTKTPAEDGDGS
jgi:predicted regulator of Ras-like GTPase activity (Roadblock/LC7/MglB family)